MPVYEPITVAGLMENYASPAGPRAHPCGGMSGAVVDKGEQWHRTGSRRKGIREHGSQTKSKIWSPVETLRG